jgi:hypothetical protein
VAFAGVSDAERTSVSIVMSEMAAADAHLCIGLAPSGYWRTPPSTTYDGYTIYETNAPSQAWSTLEALNILEACSSKMLGGQTLGQVGPASPAFWHFLVEAKKLAYNDLYAYNGDPAFVNVPVATLTSKQYAASLCAQINPNSSAPISLVGNGGSDTIVLSTADRWGNIVAWVNSNYNSLDPASPSLVTDSYFMTAERCSRSGILLRDSLRTTM